MPFKALLAAAHRAQAMRSIRLGVTGTGPTIDFPAVRAHLEAAIAAMAPHDSEARLSAWGVEIVCGSASLTGRNALRVESRTLSAPHLVLATGSDPAMPPIPGLQNTPFLATKSCSRLTI